MIDHKNPVVFRVLENGNTSILISYNISIYDNMAKVQDKTVQVQRASSTVDLVIENSVALQKAVTGLAVNLKKLSGDVSEMLELFKGATKTISEGKAEEAVKKSDIEELKMKVDELAEQNKVIAKGILLLESTLKPKEYPAY